jgi:hypothetical protein
MQTQLLLMKDTSDVMERTWTTHNQSHMDKLACSGKCWSLTLSCVSYVIVVAFDLAVAVANLAEASFTTLAPLLRPF